VLQLDEIKEFALVNLLTRGFERSPLQRNERHMSDAELVELPGGNHLAVTVDGLFEEYRLGLLRDPYLVGWANVVHSLSDLAASGASPLGVLLSYALPQGVETAWLEALQQGAKEALQAHGTFCLGGDTSFAEEAAFQCVGVGLVLGDAYLTRQGARPGDRIFATGPLGMGNLLGLARNSNLELWKELEQSYRPRARFDVVAAARPYLRASIDTSDGLLSALDLLMRTNQLGIRFAHREEVYHPRMVALSRQLGTPLWIGGAFGMGEYELLLVVESDQVVAFQKSVAGLDVDLVEVGVFQKDPEFLLCESDREVVVDTTRLLNLFAESPDPRSYIESLFAFDAELRASS
jgi:thiamine-monophosphate kinase